MEDLDDLDDLEAIFIEETFHKSEPIREKPIQHLIEKVWIRERRPKLKDLNGVTIKSEFKIARQTVSDRFAQLQARRQEAGVVFETDVDDDEDSSEDNDDDYEDANDDILHEELALSGTHSSKANKRKHLINLAKKLKKKSIANRLGMSYMPGKTKLKDLRSKLGTSKSWSEKFGRLLAAKKLLYLPLLYRRYKSGPKKTKHELDIEIDLYMAEVKGKKRSLICDAIRNAIDNQTNGNGIKVVDKSELFGGFGGPGWRKRLAPVKETPKKADKDELDMDIDRYMASKDRAAVVMNGRSEIVDKTELDMDLEVYMAAVKRNSDRQEIVANGF